MNTHHVEILMPDPPVGAASVALAWSTPRRVKSFARLHVRGLQSSFQAEIPGWAANPRGGAPSVMVTWFGATGGVITHVRARVESVQSVPLPNLPEDVTQGVSAPPQSTFTPLPAFAAPSAVGCKCGGACGGACGKTCGGACGETRPAVVDAARAGHEDGRGLGSERPVQTPVGHGMRDDLGGRLTALLHLLTDTSGVDARSVAEFIQVMDPMRTIGSSVPITVIQETARVLLADQNPHHAFGPPPLVSHIPAGKLLDCNKIFPMILDGSIYCDMATLTSYVQCMHQRIAANLAKNGEPIPALLPFVLLLIFVNVNRAMNSCKPPGTLNSTCAPNTPCKNCPTCLPGLQCFGGKCIVVSITNTPPANTAPGTATNAVSPGATGCPTCGKSGCAWKNYYYDSNGKLLDPWWKTNDGCAGPGKLQLECKDGNAPPPLCRKTNANGSYSYYIKHPCDSKGDVYAGAVSPQQDNAMKSGKYDC